MTTTSTTAAAKLPTLPTFEQAADRQFRFNSFYTVFLIEVATGKRTYLGCTSRKTGTGLMSVLRRDYIQAHIVTLPGAADATFTKSADALTLSNGYRIEFGGTIRQEATR